MPYALHTLFMYLGKPPLPAASAMMRGDLAHPIEPSRNVDWSDKAAVLCWIRAQHGAGALGPMPMERLTPALRGDIDVGLAVAMVDPGLLQKLSPSLLNSPEIALRAIATDPLCEPLFPQSTLDQLARVTADPRSIMEPSQLARAVHAVRRSPMLLAHLPMEMRNDVDVVTAAIAADPAALAFASPNFWSDPDFIAAHVPAASAARIMEHLVRAHGDDGAARMLGSNREVAALFAERTNAVALPPKTRAVIELAYAATQQRPSPFSIPRRPIPFPTY